MAFISEVKININICELHYVNLVFVNFLPGPTVLFFWHFTSFLQFDIILDILNTWLFT